MITIKNGEVVGNSKIMSRKDVIVLYPNMAMDAIINAQSRAHRYDGSLVTLDDNYENEKEGMTPLEQCFIKDRDELLKIFSISYRMYPGTRRGYLEFVRDVLMSFPGLAELSGVSDASLIDLINEEVSTSKKINYLGLPGGCNFMDVCFNEKGDFINPTTISGEGYVISSVELVRPVNNTHFLEARAASTIIADKVAEMVYERGVRIEDKIGYKTGSYYSIFPYATSAVTEDLAVAIDVLDESLAIFFYALGNEYTEISTLSNYIRIKMSNFEYHEQAEFVDDCISLITLIDKCMRDCDWFKVGILTGKNFTEQEIELLREGVLIMIRLLRRTQSIGSNKGKSDFLLNGVTVMNEGGVSPEDWKKVCERLGYVPNTRDRIIQALSALVNLLESCLMSMGMRAKHAVTCISSAGPVDMADYVSKCWTKDCSLFSYDLSLYDSTIGPSLRCCAESILHNLVDRLRDDTILMTEIMQDWSVIGCVIANLGKVLTVDREGSMIDMSLVTFRKFWGLPSGEFLTNVIGSFVHLIINQVIINRLNDKLGISVRYFISEDEYVAYDGMKVIAWISSDDVMFMTNMDEATINLFHEEVRNFDLDYGTVHKKEDAPVFLKYFYGGDLGSRIYGDDKGRLQYSNVAPCLMMSRLMKRFLPERQRRADVRVIAAYLSDVIALELYPIVSYKQWYLDIMSKYLSVIGREEFIVSDKEGAFMMLGSHQFNLMLNEYIESLGGNLKMVDIIGIEFGMLGIGDYLDEDEFRSSTLSIDALLSMIRDRTDNFNVFKLINYLITRNNYEIKGSH